MHLDSTINGFQTKLN